MTRAAIAGARDRVARSALPLTRRAAIGLVLLLGATALAAHGAADAKTTFPLRLGGKLRAAGRAECAFTRSMADPWNGGTSLTRGRLALELPDRARLDFPSTGETVTLRADGGEWLQPRLKQLVAFTPARAGEAKRWWQLLIDGAAPGIDVSPRGHRRFMLYSSAGGPDSASIELDAAGMPARLLVSDPAQHVEYRFSGWRFVAARGVPGFHQELPAGFERVELP